MDGQIDKPKSKLHTCKRQLIWYMMLLLSISLHVDKKFSYEWLDDILLLARSYTDPGGRMLGLYPLSVISRGSLNSYHNGELIK